MVGADFLRPDGEWLRPNGDIEAHDPAEEGGDRGAGEGAALHAGSRHPRGGGRAGGAAGDLHAEVRVGE